MDGTKHVVVPLADGFEEIEAIAVIDVLRRAGLRVTIAGVGGTSAIGSHGIGVRCDARLEECDARGVDAVVLPGGMPGTTRLRESTDLAALLEQVNSRGGLVAAICAAPTVLHAVGLLDGLRATSHPAHASELTRCRYQEDAVVVDGNVVTSRGAGTAIEFAAAVASRLVGERTARDILAAIQFGS